MTTQTLHNIHIQTHIDAKALTDTLEKLCTSHANDKSTWKIEAYYEAGDQGISVKKRQHLLIIILRLFHSFVPIIIAYESIVHLQLEAEALDKPSKMKKKKPTMLN